MRMDRDKGVDGPLISGFAGRGFRVDDGVYEGLLITPNRADGWSPPALDALSEADLAPVLLLDPRAEFILIGTGTTLRRPRPALIAAIEARDIGVEVMDSRAAARAWGVLRGEGRWIAAALLPFD